MLRILRRHWFLVGLVAVLAAAAIAPGIGKGGGPLASQTWQGWLVAGIFLLSGFDLRTSELRSAFRDVRLHAFVQGTSLLVAPLLFYAAARLLSQTPLPAPLLEGFVVLGCLPTTVTSGVAFTRASGGDEAAALFNATLGNLLGIVVTPFTILIATGRHGVVPASSIAAQLAWQVAAPVAAGQVLRALLGARADAVRARLGPMGSLLLLALIYVVFCDSLSRGFDLGAAELAAALVIACLLHALLVFVAFRASALPIWQMSRAKRTAAVICSTQKTAALGLPLLAILYRDDARVGLVAVPLLLYHPLQLVVAGAAVDAWRRFNGVASPPEPTSPERSAR
jgi:sodium/bile acid cotransporter 7